MVERGPYVSYANCGLPHHVGGVIEKEASLLVASEQLFREQFAIDVRTRCEAIDISPQEKTVTLRNVATGELTTESYDKLVISPGAASVHPPLPGIDLPGIFHVRTVPDARAIVEWVERGNPFFAGMFKYSGFQAVKPKTRAVVVGGGFIGLEMGAHTGTHMDAPAHFVRGGVGIDALPLDTAIGWARVIAIKDAESIKPEELRRHRLRRGEQILFKTGNSARCWDQDSFVEDFVYLSAAAAQYLAERQVRLVGIDSSPSAVSEPMEWKRTRPCSRPASGSSRGLT
jgi:kynurenine formamidase